jgi:cytochrome c oxidase cbb3-type subunit 3
MSSRCRNPSPRRIAAGLLLAALAVIWAEKSRAQQGTSPPGANSGPGFVAVTGLFPGGGSPPPPDPVAKQFQGNPQDIADGGRLFLWYNCVGCHFHGGGGIGPALMSNHWRYGGRLDQIFESISQGRPNGMPSWHGKIPDAQIWQLAAFVRSLSVPSAANGGPGEAMPVAPAPPAAPPPPPKTAAPGVGSTPPQ